MAEELTVASAGVRLSGIEEPARGDEQGTIVTLHGLTATRRTVVHGSRHLPRAGFRLVGYDARGHGASEAPPEGAYGYGELTGDAAAVIAARARGERPVLAGHSMGAHTAAALALREPDALAGLVLIGPAVLGSEPAADSLAYWDRLAAGMEEGGAEGFVQAYDRDLPAEWRDTLLRIARQRLQEHRHPEGVARALREVPRSVPFEGIDALGALDLPALVVASHDEADSGHPFAVAQEWAEALPRARLISEERGESPLAWQGGRLSRAIEEFCRSADVRERLAP